MTFRRFYLRRRRAEVEVERLRFYGLDATAARRLGVRVVSVTVRAPS